MIRKVALAIVLLNLSLSAHAVDGMVNVSSKHTVSETTVRLVNILESKSMKIIARVPHSDAAKSVGVDLLPMELVIFGNPKVGSPLMKCAGSVAIDLPQKALIWQDRNNEVWISYNNPDYLKSRHNIRGCDEVLKKVSGALSGMIRAAAE